MAYQIEFFRRTATHPQGEPMGARLEGFSSRRAARTVAERHRPGDADGFRIYGDGELLISLDLQRATAETDSPPPQAPL